MSNYVSKRGEVIAKEWRDVVSRRYRTVTHAVNTEFRDSTSETANSLYVGSYGRGTAIDTSDIDIMLILPQGEYTRHEAMKGNGQSRLLQAIRNAVKVTYPNSDIRADGQVVKINFSDGVRFELLPVFETSDYWGRKVYTYPDTNMGGNWKSTNPRAEQDTMKQKNYDSNGLLFDTCKHIRRIRDTQFSSYHLSGIVIDSFAYAAIGSWKWLNTGETTSSAWGDYEQQLLSYLQTHSLRDRINLNAPGSSQPIDSSSSYMCLEKVLKYMAGEN